MANVKFYKGELKNIPAAAKSEEGRIYFAYSTSGSGSDIKYSPEGIYLDLGTEDKKRLKMTAKSDFATGATNDGGGDNIRNTYLKSLKFADAGTNLVMIKGSGAETKLAMPVASSTSAGIVSTGAQTFAGTKTFSNITVTTVSGFNYSGIEVATGNAARPVWFAYSGINGKPVYNTNFTFNPATGTLTATNFNGLATKATGDGNGNNIRSTYASNTGFSFAAAADKVTFTSTAGSGAKNTINIPNASSTSAGIVTAQAQTFAGSKTFANSINFANDSIGLVWNRVTDGASILFKAETDATDNYLEFHVTDDENVNFKWTKAVGSENLTLGTWKREGIRLGSGTFIGDLTGNASSATKATYDSTGSQAITGYLRGVTISGQKITFTKGSGETVEISTQDLNNKVTQTAIAIADYTNWRTILWGASNSATEGFAPTTVTDGTFTSTNLSFQPSSGTLRATTFKGNLTGNASSATKATQDSSGNTINATYPTITSMSFSNPSATVTQLNFKDGSGKAHTAITIPAATGSLSGILTAAAQTIGGAKTFTGAMTVNSTITSNDTIQGAILCATNKMPLASGKVTSLKSGTTRVYSDGIAISNPATANDVGWIRVTGTGENDTVLEIGTGDDGGTGEQIVVRQYNTSNTVARYLTLLDTAGRSYFRDIYPQSVNSFSLGSSAARFLNGYIDHTKVIDLEVASKVTLKYNSDNACLDFVFA